jgi:hypothetical protein
MFIEAREKTARTPSGVPCAACVEDTSLLKSENFRMLRLR